jgi:hypothetical protein
MRTFNNCNCFYRHDVLILIAILNFMLWYKYELKIMRVFNNCVCTHFLIVNVFLIFFALV